MVIFKTKRFIIKQFIGRDHIGLSYIAEKQKIYNIIVSIGNVVCVIFKF